VAVSEKAVKTRNTFGETALHLLCDCGAPQDALEVLLAVCPDLAQEKDKQGRIALHATVQGSRSDGRLHEETFQCLLQENYALGVGSLDNNGKTPLMLACERNISLNLLYQLFRVDPISNMNALRG